MDNFSDRLTLEGAGGQSYDSRSTFSSPEKFGVITVQTSYWEVRWHQNCGHTSPILFWGVRTRKSAKNGAFLLIAPYPKFFNRK